MNSRQSVRLLLLAIGFGLLLAGSLAIYVMNDTSRGAEGGEARVDATLRVLAYSSFVNAWGPGPEIIKRFEAQTGVRVELRDAEDAGLLLKKLEMFPADVVVGFDQLMIAEARAARAWLTIPLEPEGEEGRASAARFHQNPFLAFDWGPLAFVYRENEIAPPVSLDDLLDDRFRNMIALQDPRVSSPGLQFLYWVLDQKGIEAGFEFLAKLKPMIHTLGGSWSSAYGVFQSGRAKVALSYLTSPLYHWTQENDRRYKAAVFAEGHPAQVEYVGVPASCRHCGPALRFARFMLEPESQKILMTKNFMLPVRGGARQGTEFANLPEVKIREMASVEQLNRERAALLRRWQELGL